MGWWSRWRGVRSKAGSDRQLEQRLLVISDLHLGEDVVDTSVDLSRYISTSNRELAAFLRAHRQRDVEWHLVINGDMFDFVKMSLGADEVGPDSDVNTASVVAMKLDRIFEIHRPLFKELAEFVRVGHRLTVIEGNHDAESFFDEVRVGFVTNLERLARRNHTGGAPFDAEAFTARVRFRTWFEAEPGRYHIEHGHAYDEFCGFEYNLAPFDRPGADHLATPLTHTAIPEFAKALGDFTTHGIEKLSTWQHMRAILSLGPRMVFLLMSLYAQAVAQVLRKAGPRGRQDRAELAELQEARLRELSEHTHYGLPTLRALDELRATPAEYSVVKMVCAFHADRFLVIGLGAIGLTVAFVVGGGPGWIVAAGTGVLGAVITQLAHRNRSGHVASDLEQAAERVASITGARYVIFGHSHQPVLLDLQKKYGNSRFGERAFYVNSGSWVTREILRGDEGCGMTYVEVGADGAALRRWRGSDEPERLAGARAEPGLEPEPEVLMLPSPDPESSASEER
ncbi:MAG: metallophosphoesterase [Myxococcota bacterium]